MRWANENHNDTIDLFLQSFVYLKTFLLLPTSPHLLCITFSPNRNIPATSNNENENRHNNNVSEIQLNCLGLLMKGMEPNRIIVLNLHEFILNQTKIANDGNCQLRNEDEWMEIHID
ncbi:hypothetical protein SNEBB_005568 [Seison nebaliae]|nr:hypothetical protein SNEBB_005568 [Seison nebaliae]